MKDFWLKMKESFKHHWGEFIKEGKTCVNEFKNPQTRKKQIPNLFTASRLFAPFFIIPTALSGNLPLTAIFVTTFALTDAADGYFARKYNATSEFGRKLDALTDKLFAASLLIPLTITNPILLTVFTMEGVISGVNVYSQLADNTPKTEYIGKIKTAALFSTIGLNYISLVTNIPNLALNIMTGSTVVLQLLTAAKYLDVLSVKEHEKGLNESKTKIELDIPTELEDGEKINVLELEASTPTIHNDNIIDISAVSRSDDISTEERVRQLREMREQLIYQEPEEEAVQKKIGVQN